MAQQSIMLHKLKTGMTIAEDIYHHSQLLVPKNTVVTPAVLDLLNHSTIVAVMISTTEPPTTTAAPKTAHVTHSQQLRSSETFQKFEQHFEETTTEFTFQLNDIASHAGYVDMDGLFASANELMADTTNTYQLMDILNNIRYFDDSTYAHSLNVAMLANIFGRWMHYDEKDLKLLTVAGMLHDIGKISIPAEIIKKPGKLTIEEFNIIKKHPLNGYQLLMERNVDIRISQAALMHHEKCDGSGYPLCVKGNQISDLAKIITIVDVYEALTANRCYREGICPFDVIRMFEDDGYQKYDVRFLIPFLRGISDTYLHNTVLLNDGRTGEVVMTNQMNPARPSVLCGNDYLDLTRYPDLKIEAIL